MVFDVINIVGKIVKSGVNKGRLKIKCPFCKKNHFHGLAEDEKSPTHRLSHCHKTTHEESFMIHF